MEQTKIVALQNIRRKEIPVIIAKYQTLIDKVWEEVIKPFPTFTNITIKNETDDVIKHVSAEEQMYSYMLMRERAIDHANTMSNKINLLELEMNEPELFKKLNEPEPKEEAKAATTAVKKSHAKAAAEKK